MLDMQQVWVTCKCDGVECLVAIHTRKDVHWCWITLSNDQGTTGGHVWCWIGNQLYSPLSSAKSLYSLPNPSLTHLITTNSLILQTFSAQCTSCSLTLHSPSPCPCLSVVPQRLQTLSPHALPNPIGFKYVHFTIFLFWIQGC